MSGVTASRGEMMQVTPDVARDQGEFFLFVVLQESDSFAGFEKKVTGHDYASVTLRWC